MIFNSWLSLNTWWTDILQQGHSWRRAGVFIVAYKRSTRQSIWVLWLQIKSTQINPANQKEGKWKIMATMNYIYRYLTYKTKHSSMILLYNNQRDWTWQICSMPINIRSTTQSQCTIHKENCGPVTEKKKKKKTWLSLFFGKLVYISRTATLLYCFSTNIPRSDGNPPVHGLVCSTRSGFHVTDSYFSGNTLQCEMDGSNFILFLCQKKVEKWFSRHRQLQQ
jgi:hypothetical protein